MNDDFADWYRRVDIEPRSEDLQKRWQAIEAFHQKPTPSDLAEATRLFFGLPPRGGNFLAKYRAEFKATDDVFPMRDNDAELQALAGAMLANHFGHEDNWAILAAMLFSLLQTLCLWQLNPRSWLTAYPTACAEAGGEVPEDVERFLPWNLSDKDRQRWSLAVAEAGTDTS